MDEAGRNKLWLDYDKSNQNPAIREKIILEYAPLVKLVAGRLSMYLGYNVEYDDLVSYGIFGLIDAIGGIDVDVPMEFCEQDSNRNFGESEICLKKGYQHLNGEQALALA